MQNERGRRHDDGRGINAILVVGVTLFVLAMIAGVTLG